MLHGKNVAYHPLSTTCTKIRLFVTIPQECCTFRAVVQASMETSSASNVVRAHSLPSHPLPALVRAFDPPLNCVLCVLPLVLSWALLCFALRRPTHLTFPPYQYTFVRCGTLALSLALPFSCLLLSSLQLCLGLRLPGHNMFVPKKFSTDDDNVLEEMVAHDLSVRSFLCPSPSELPCLVHAMLSLLPLIWL
jgi:hypothetical protein